MDKLIDVLLAIHYDILFIEFMATIRAICCIISLFKDD